MHKSKLARSRAVINFAVHDDNLDIANVKLIFHGTIMAM